MRLRIPIYGQILGWFFLNLAMLSAIFYLFARLELRLRLDSLLLGAAGDRIQAVGNIIAQELSEGGRPQWDAILLKFTEAYGIEFSLFLNDASQLAGSKTVLPAAVRQKILEGRVPTRPALREPLPPRTRKSARRPQRQAPGGQSGTQNSCCRRARRRAIGWGFGYRCPMGNSHTACRRRCW